ncbi:MAG: sensor histidine kinase [Eubacteriales bacterium]|nr:sensor histidine kinase [Eubacteriales bacterium]
MRGLLERAMTRLHLGESIVERLRVSFLILMGLLIVPALVSLGMMMHYAQTYHGVIRQVEQVSSLKPLVQTQIADEMWYVVAGHKSFDGGEQYEMIRQVNDGIDALTRSADPQNLKELIVARRTMGTLVNYIDRMGELIRTEQPIAESEALLEEVRNVSSLVADMLAEYADGEISAAAQASDQLQATLNVVLVVLLALLGITVLFSMLAQQSLTNAIRTPIARLEKFAASLAGGDLQARAPETPVTELHELTQSLNTMAGRLQDLIDENRREQENLKKSELRALQAQINPHFLYNTLDAIVWLAEAGQSREVIHITRALSDFFRISLSQGKDWIPLSEEIKHLTGYLTIQKIRYRDILDYQIDIPEELGSCQVLKLLMQPLVENAIYHGVKHRRGRGLVRVTGRMEDSWLILEVADNGAGMTPERLAQVREGLSGSGAESAGYGLFNVNKRIQLYYNQPQGVWIESRPGEGTSVTLKLPVRLLPPA